MMYVNDKLGGRIQAQGTPGTPVARVPFWERARRDAAHASADDALAVTVAQFPFWERALARPAYPEPRKEPRTEFRNDLRMERASALNRLVTPQSLALRPRAERVTFPNFLIGRTKRLETPVSLSKHYEEVAPNREKIRPYKNQKRHGKRRSFPMESGRIDRESRALQKHKTAYSLIVTLRAQASDRGCTNSRLAARIGREARIGRKEATGATRMKKVPVSILLFIFTGVVFLVQHLALVGVFLMIVGAPFWSVITINLGFVLMAKEAWQGKLPRALVVLPILYFSIYAGVTIAGHSQLQRLRGEIAATNRAAHLAFDPQQNDLVIAAKVVDSGPTLSKVAENLIEAYDIPVVYGVNGSRRGPAHLSYRIAEKKDCNAIKRGDPNIVTFAFQENGVFNFNLCLVRRPEDPTKPAVTVTAEESPATLDWLLPTTLETITVTDAENQTVTLEGGTAAPFAWIPLPVMGCALDSASPKWRCFAEFERAAFTPLAGERGHDLDRNANTAAIAAALGLEPKLASQRINASAN